MAHKKRHKFDIDGSGLKSLHDLVRFDVHQFVLAQGKYRKCKVRYEAQFKKFMSRIMRRLKKKKERKAMKLAHQMFRQPEYKFSIDFYYNFLDMTKLPLKFHMQIATYLQTVANKMMQLHLRECQILQKNRNDARVIYCRFGHSLHMEHLHNLIVPRESKEYYFTVSCELCMRGCLLFNTLADVYRILNMLRLPRPNYNHNYKRKNKFKHINVDDHNKLVEEYCWKYMNFFKINYRQFEYCPYHMKADNSSVNSKSDSKKDNGILHQEITQMRINSMIINHSAYSVKMNKDAPKYRLFKSIWNSIVSLAGITANKGEYCKLFQIGTIILDISTKLLQLMTKSTSTSVWQSFVALLNLSSMCVGHYKAKSTLPGFGLEIVLLAFFRVAIDKDEIQLFDEFDNQQGQLSKCLEMMDINIEDKSKHINTTDIVFAFWLNHVSPLKYISAGCYFDYLCKKMVNLEKKHQLNENIEMEDIMYNPRKDLDSFD